MSLKGKTNNARTQSDSTAANRRCVLNRLGYTMSQAHQTLCCQRHTGTQTQTHKLLFKRAGGGTFRSAAAATNWSLSVKQQTSMLLSYIIATCSQRLANLGSYCAVCGSCRNPVTDWQAFTAKEEGRPLQYFRSISEEQCLSCSAPCWARRHTTDTTIVMLLCTRSLGVMV